MPAWLGPAISAGGQLLGGFLGNRSQRSAQGRQDDLLRQQWGREDDLYARDLATADAWYMRDIGRADSIRATDRQQTNLWNQAAYNRAVHRDSQADHQWQATYNRRVHEFDVAERNRLRAIQDRVADAKAAGLHPLFAMGIQSGAGGQLITPPGGLGGSFAPASSSSSGGLRSSPPRRSSSGAPLLSGQAPTGSHLGVGVMSALNGIGNFYTRMADAQKDAALAQSVNSMLKREQQMNESTYAWTHALGPESDIVETMLSPVRAKRPSSKPLHPASHDRVRMPNGRLRRIVSRDVGDEVRQLSYIMQSVADWFGGGGSNRRGKDFAPGLRGRSK